MLTAATKDLAASGASGVINCGKSGSRGSSHKPQELGAQAGFVGGEVHTCEVRMTCPRVFI